MSWLDYYRCDAGHIGLRPQIFFTIGDTAYTACSQECRNKIEADQARRRVTEDGGK